MCKFDGILKWESWGTAGKVGQIWIEKYQDKMIQCKKNKYPHKRGYLENQISQHGHCLCLVIQNHKVAESKSIYTSYSHPSPMV